MHIFALCQLPVLCIFTTIFSAYLLRVGFVPIFRKTLYLRWSGSPFTITPYFTFPYFLANIYITCLYHKEVKLGIFFIEFKSISQQTICTRTFPIDEEVTSKYLLFMWHPVFGSYVHSFKERRSGDGLKFYKLILYFKNLQDITENL